MKRRNLIEPSAAWDDLFVVLCRRMGLDPEKVALKVSDQIRVPMVVGWFRPLVIFPACLFGGLTVEQVEFILAHELAHVRRNDYLINLFQIAVETILFYHPAVWWISRQIRVERENCCDDMVATQPAEVLTYIQALSRIDALRQTDLAQAANGGDLLARIKRMVERPSVTNFPVSLRWVSGLILFVAVAGLSLTVRAENNSTAAVVPIEAGENKKQADATSPARLRFGKKVRETLISIKLENMEVKAAMQAVQKAAEEKGFTLEFDLDGFTGQPDRRVSYAAEGTSVENAVRLICLMNGLEMAVMENCQGYRIAPEPVRPAAASNDSNSPVKKAEHPGLGVNSGPVEKETSLDEAVAEFNRLAGKDEVGRTQPPLTPDEVVAAIFGYIPPPAMSPVIREIYDGIAANRVLPPGAELGFCKKWVGYNGTDFDVWWIDLKVDSVVEGGYNMRVRARMISSTAHSETAMR